MGTFKIPADQPIENRMISKQLEAAQARIEGFHFDARKQVLAYDNVQNQQRQVVYRRRLKLLRGEQDEIDAIVAEMIDEVPDVAPVVEQKRAEFGEQWNEIIRKLSLQMIDTLWVEHLEVMQFTRASVNLRAYGQKDPLNEYKREGKRLFTEMQAAVLHRMAEVLPNLQPQALEQEEAQLREERKAAQRSGGTSARSTPTKQAPKVAEHTPGRNDVVTITNGSDTKELKYKKAEPLLADGWQLVEKT